MGLIITHWMTFHWMYYYFYQTKKQAIKIHKLFKYSIFCVTIAKVCEFRESLRKTVFISCSVILWEDKTLPVHNGACKRRDSKSVLINWQETMRLILTSDFLHCHILFFSTPVVESVLIAALGLQVFQTQRSICDSMGSLCVRGLGFEEMAGCQ